jgi:hypothetical protein
MSLLVAPAGRHIDLDSGQCLAQIMDCIVQRLNAAFVRRLFPAAISNQTGPGGIAQTLFDRIDRRRRLSPRRLWRRGWSRGRTHRFPRC